MSTATTEGAAVRIVTQLAGGAGMRSQARRAVKVPVLLALAAAGLGAGLALSTPSGQLNTASVLGDLRRLLTTPAPPRAADEAGERQSDAGGAGGTSTRRVP